MLQRTSARGTYVFDAVGHGLVSHADGNEGGLDKRPGDGSAERSDEHGGLSRTEGGADVSSLLSVSRRRAHIEQTAYKGRV
jgi:hypothetical protein